MAMYLTAMYQAVCYDADGVLGGGGGRFVLVRCMYGLLRSTARCQVGAGRRSQVTGRQDLVHGRSKIDGDAVSMTEGGYPKLQGLGEGKSGPGVMKL